jgi:hypothetical protein
MLRWSEESADRFMKWWCNAVIPKNQPNCQSKCHWAGRRRYPGIGEDAAGIGENAEQDEETGGTPTDPESGGTPEQITLFQSTSA